MLGVWQRPNSLDLLLFSYVIAIAATGILALAFLRRETAAGGK